MNNLKNLLLTLSISSLMCSGILAMKEDDDNSEFNDHNFWNFKTHLMDKNKDNSDANIISDISNIKKGGALFLGAVMTGIAIKAVKNYFTERVNSLSELNLKFTEKYKDLVNNFETIDIIEIVTEFTRTLTDDQYSIEGISEFISEALDNTVLFQLLSERLPNFNPSLEQSFLIELIIKKHRINGINELEKHFDKLCQSNKGK